MRIFYMTWMLDTMFDGNFLFCCSWIMLDSRRGRRWYQRIWIQHGTRRYESFQKFWMCWISPRGDGNLVHTLISCPFGGCWKFRSVDTTWSLSSFFGKASRAQLTSPPSSSSFVFSWIEHGNSDMDITWLGHVHLSALQSRWTLYKANSLLTLSKFRFITFLS